MWFIKSSVLDRCIEQTIMVVYVNHLTHVSVQYLGLLWSWFMFNVYGIEKGSLPPTSILSLMALLYYYFIRTENIK